MRKMVTAIVVLMSLILTGCGADEEPTNRSAPTDAAPSADTTAPPPTSGNQGSNNATGGTGRPLGPQQRAAFLRAVSRLHPNMDSKPDAVIQVALRVCADLQQGIPPGGAAGGAAGRLFNLGIGLDMEPSKQFVQVAKRHLCP